MRRGSSVLALVLLLAACKSSDRPADHAGSATATPPLPPMTATATTSPTPPAKPAPVVEPASFDRHCAAATDCVVVKRAACDPCGCPVDAIASKDMAKFDEATSKLSCDPPDLTVKCAPCEARVAACEKATCVAVPRK